MGRVLAIIISIVLVAAAAYLFLSQRQNVPAQISNPPASTPSSDASNNPPASPVTLSKPAGYEVVAYLSDEQVQTFTEAEQVVEEGKDYVAMINTTKGSMLIDLYEETPVTINNFIFLALNHYYEGIVFHRVLEDFMAQAGDPTGTGRGGPGYDFEDEFVEGLVHDDKGILSMANAGPNTNGSQFFITFEATPFLDGRHSVFGKVIEGSEVLDMLQRIDPSQPRVLIETDKTLAELEAEGISLKGEADKSIEAYLSEALGAAPIQGRSFEVDGYKGILGTARTAEGTVAMYGFDSPPDVIESVQIYAR